MKIFLFLFITAIITNTAMAADYYSQGSADANTLSNWNTVRAGGGTSPANFTTSGDKFIIQSTHSLTNSGTWTATGNSIQIESGGILTASYLVICAVFQIDDGGAYIHDAASGTANGALTDLPGSSTRTFGASSDVTFKKWANGGTAPVGFPAITGGWGNLTLDITTLAGRINAGTGTNFSQATNAAAGSITAGSATVTLAASNANIVAGQYVAGSGIPLNTTVAAVSGTTLTLSQNATLTNSTAVTLNFTNEFKVKGNFNILQTGGGTNVFRFVSSGFVQVSVLGDFNMQGGYFALTNQSSGNIPIGLTIGGDLKITGGQMALDDFSGSSAGFCPTLTVNGDTELSAGTFYAGNSSAANNGMSYAMNFNGNFLQSGGIFGWDNSTTGLRSIGVTVGGNFTITGGTFNNPGSWSTTAGGATILFTGTNNSVLTVPASVANANIGWIVPGGKTVTLGSNLTVGRFFSVAGILNMGSYIISGNSSFIILPSSSITFTGNLAIFDYKIQSPSSIMNLLYGMSISGEGLRENTIISQVGNSAGSPQVGIIPVSFNTTALTGVTFTATSAAGTVSTGLNLTAAIANTIKTFSTGSNYAFSGSAAQNINTPNSLLTTSMGTFTTGSATLTLNEANNSVVVGHVVSSPTNGINNLTVSAINGTQITLSGNATGNGIAMVYFSVPFTANNLTVSNTANTVTAAGAINVNGTLTTAAGANLNMNTFALGGTLNTIANTGTIRTSNTSSAPFPAGKTWGGTVNYALAGGGQTITAGTYNNLTLSNSSGTDAIAASGTITVNGTLTSPSSTGIFSIPSGTTASLGSGALLKMSGGSISNSGTLQYDTAIGTDVTYVTGTYTGSGPELIPNGASSIIRNLTIGVVSGTNASVTTPSGTSLTIAGDVLVNNSTSASVLTLGNTLNTAGNWTNNGTFTHNNKTVNLTGGNQTIAGASTFYNLSKSVSSAASLTFTAGSTQTISNLLTLTGASGQLLTINSSSAGVQASINPSTSVVRYVNVSDNNNISSTAIYPASSVNGGNTANWIYTANLVWTGALSSDWSTAGNWDLGVVPSSGDNVTITKSGSNNLTLDTSPTIGNFAISSGNTISGGTGKTLTVLGNWVNDGIFNGSTGTVILSGSYFSGGGNTNFNHVTFNKSLTLNSTAAVSGTISIGSGFILNSNNNLTLTSGASSNANVGPFSGGAAITGNVNVQSYFTGGTAAYRSTRLISPPINETGLASKVFAQLKNYMIITGPGGVSNGFDLGGVYQPHAATLTKYNEAAALSQPQFTNVAAITESLLPGAGAFLFYRGNRDGYSSDGTTAVSNKINGPYANPESTTVTYTGPINQGTINVNLSYTANSGDTRNGYNLIGNPYPCVIDWESVTRNNTANELKIIKPGGGYATYLDGISAGGTNVRYIQPGQGFYTRATSAGASVTFNESSKSVASVPERLLNKDNGDYLSLSGKPVKSGVRTLSGAIKQLRIRLEDEVNTEEAVCVFKTGKSAASGIEDAMFFGGSTISLSTLSSDNVKLTINFMPELNTVKELNLAIGSSGSGTLKLNFTDLSALENSSAFLLDNFTGALTDIKANPEYLFSVNTSNSASLGDQRFKLLFAPISTLSVKLSNFTAAKQGRTVMLRWQAMSDTRLKQFEVERSSSGESFEKIGTVYENDPFSGNNSYSYIDELPFTGLNYYRLKMTNSDGSISYSSASVIMAEEINFSIYPNPASDKMWITLNSRQAGVEVSITDILGREIRTITFEDKQLAAEENVQNLPAGIYFILVKDRNNNLLGEAKLIKK